MNTNRDLPAGMMRRSLAVLSGRSRDEVAERSVAAPCRQSELLQRNRSWRLFATGREKEASGDLSEAACTHSARQASDKTQVAASLEVTLEAPPGLQSSTTLPLRIAAENERLLDLWLEGRE